ncbi:MAG: anti-sigma regulatory factor [Nocardioides sp.]|nr:anti-sigma regulatory factor [Nocardioides sp.]
MPDPRELDLDLAAVPESVDAAQEALAALWDQVPDLESGVQLRFELALVEILANIVEHAYEADTEPHVRRLAMRVTVSDEALVGELSDNGQPASLDLSDVSLPDDLAESGRGLAMASSALDRLDYSRDDGRNRWHLECRRRTT